MHNYTNTLISETISQFKSIIAHVEMWAGLIIVFSVLW